MRARSEHRCSTRCVRPIADVITDLRALLVRKLPGSQAVAAAWATVNECAQTIGQGNALLSEEEVPDHTRWTTHGEIRVASAIARKVADEFRVPVMECDR